MGDVYVVLGDVVESRDVEDREALQERLRAACEEVTASEGQDVYADFEILKGVDEFGGVLQSVESLYDVVAQFQTAARPHRVRMAVAAGEVDLGAPADGVRAMDGEAFHRADDLLAAVESGPRDVDVALEDAAFGHLVADEINLLLDRRREWTDRQREVIAAVDAAGTQAAAATNLGVSQQAVSNVLRGADWPLVRAVEERLRNVLAAYAARAPGRG